VLGIATGDSGVYNLGRRPASLAQLEEYVTTLRSLWRTGEAMYEGSTVRTSWSRAPIPVYLAVGGPRGLRLAGRIADGVFVEAGLLPDVVADALEQLARGAAEAGRTISDIDVWWHARADFGDSVEEATTRLRSALAGMGNRLLRFGHEGKHVPEDLLPALEALQANYEFLHHEEHGGKLRNAPLVDELGLRDYLAARFGILGTPDDWVHRLDELAAIGVRQIAFAGLMNDKLGFLRTLAGEVAPRLADEPHSD
jgi:5,10-methylenetetrahydromethanopterin reductase